MIRMLARALALPLIVQVVGCKDSNPAETVIVSLNNAEVYQYPTVSGDEEGARISRQATHYSISEIRRDEATNWVAVYVYRPAAGFIGSDYAEIEILTGSDGSGPPTNIKKVAFRFTVHE